MTFQPSEKEIHGVGVGDGGEREFRIGINGVDDDGCRSLR